MPPPQSDIPLTAPPPEQPDFGSLCVRREARARALAESHPAARQALEFYADIAAFQARVSAAAPAESRSDLVELIAQIAPAPLRHAARRFDAAECELAFEAHRRGDDIESPRSFFARVLLGPAAAVGAAGCKHRDANPGVSVDTCPRCGQAPQVGCLRTSSDGTALSLICSLCLAEWTFPRVRCPACSQADDGRLAWYGTDDLAQLQVRACESCNRYLHVVSLVADPRAVADVDEIVALPLDLWASEQGYRKLRPNLVGI